MNDLISRKAVLDLFYDDDEEYTGAEIYGIIKNVQSYSLKEHGDLISRDYAIKKIRAEIKEWYWQADKQALAKDPCVVDAMVDLFIRTINKYIESEEE